MHGTRSQDCIIKSLNYCAVFLLCEVEKIVFRARDCLFYTFTPISINSSSIWLFFLRSRTRQQQQQLLWKLNKAEFNLKLLCEKWSQGERQYKNTIWFFDGANWKIKQILKKTRKIRIFVLQMLEKLNVSSLWTLPAFINLSHSYYHCCCYYNYTFKSDYLKFTWKSFQIKITFCV